MSDAPRLTIDIIKTWIYYNIFFKNFFNKFILAKIEKRIEFLDLKYRKIDLSF